MNKKQFTEKMEQIRAIEALKTVESDNTSVLITHNSGYRYLLVKKADKGFKLHENASWYYLGCTEWSGNYRSLSEHIERNHDFRMIKSIDISY